MLDEDRKTADLLKASLVSAWREAGEPKKADLARDLTARAGRLCSPQTVNSWFKTGRMDKFWLSIVRQALPGFRFGQDFPSTPYVEGGNVVTTHLPVVSGWEMLVNKFNELPQYFTLNVDQDWLAPSVTKGDTLTFDKLESPYAGAFVVVQARSGALLLREYRELEPGVFRAVAGPHSGIEPMHSKHDGLEVIATYIHHGKPSPRQLARLANTALAGSQKTQERTL